MRLHTDFFEKPAIRHIQTLKKWESIIVILLKLSLMSVKYDGELRVSNSVPYSIKSLSKVLSIRESTLRETLNLLIDLDLVSIEGDSIIMNQVIKSTGSETPSAERKRDQRERELREQIKKEILEEAINSNTDYRTNREHLGKEKVAEYVWLSKKEYELLANEFDEELVQEKIDEMSEYIAMKGTYYADHYRALINWLNKDDDY
jgi:predicted phage replisome organizer